MIFLLITFFLNAANKKAQSMFQFPVATDKYVALYRARAAKGVKFKIARYDFTYFRSIKVAEKGAKIQGGGNFYKIISQFGSPEIYSETIEIVRYDNPKRETHGLNMLEHDISTDKYSMLVLCKT